MDYRCQSVGLIGHIKQGDQGARDGSQNENHIGLKGTKLVPDT